MDVISYSKASAQEVRIKKIIAEPDSTSGLVTMPSVIASGETTTIPAGRVVVHPNLQVDGTLDVQGSLFVPAGGTLTEEVVQAAIVEATGTGYMKVAVGTTAQRPVSPTDGQIRYNTDLNALEGYSNGAWGSLGGGATGGGQDRVFNLNGQVITTNYTIPVGMNAVSAGDITIASGVTVEISSGSKWSIV